MSENLSNDERLVIPRVGKNLPNVLSRSLVADPYAAVCELVCNAYDADAEKVHIDIDKGLGRITIHDDGNGMDRGGLENFFRLGDSEKIGQLLSSVKRRRRVGKYGIAKVLIQYLGDSFGVESVKDRRKYIIKEGVTEGDLKVEEISVGKKVRNGTTIEIRELRFQPDTEQFSISRLYSRLQWDPPNQPDFDVFVNGGLVKKRGGVSYAQTYRVKKDLGEGRKIHGRIYYMKSGGKRLEGVRIYVNNRAVGDERLFDIEGISLVLARGRLQGEIHADFLEPFITLDRSDFQEDPLVEQTVEAVREVLRAIKQDNDTRTISKTEFYSGLGDLNTPIDRALWSAQEQLNRRLETNYTLKLSNGADAGPVARLDSERNIIFINSGCRAFTFLRKTKKSRSRKDSEVYLRRAFLTAATMAHTSGKFGDQRFEYFLAQRLDESFAQFDGIARIARRYGDRPVLTPLQEITFNPYRLYDPQELSLLTGRPPKIIRLLHTCGALPGTKDHLFDMEGILGALKPLEGLVSAIEIVDNRYVKVNTGSALGVRVVYTHPRATPIDEYLYSNLEVASRFKGQNIGVSHPLFFIPEGNYDFFKTFVQEGKIYTPKVSGQMSTGRGPGRPRKKIGN